MSRRKVGREELREQERRGIENKVFKKLEACNSMQFFIIWKGWHSTGWISQLSKLSDKIEIPF